MAANNTPTRLQWSEPFSVGIPEIDEQHKTLFDLIDKIHTAILHHKGSAACAEVLDELVDYTRIHFGLEQCLMHIAKYPEYEAHCFLHRKLVSEVEALQHKIHSGKAAISFELLHFLRTWLTTHILGEDKKYAVFFASDKYGNFNAWAPRFGERLQKQKKKWWKFW
ncbi:MAG: bacteriohemerythrin [Betaproteobacteria bacterium]|nr:bacteriohemerythrin [Betaproteobacteria bacterium]